MAKLTFEQMAFLTRHKIPLGQVFDATGMRQIDYAEAMRKQDKLFAFATTPCEKSGHTLRSRSGNCIECNTANIAFTMRAYKDAYVYIAGSRSSKLIKVGSTTYLEKRFDSINSEAYGGANDWICIAYVKCEKAGTVEFAVHQRLHAFSFAAQYVRSGRMHDAYELFSCGYSNARIALIASLPEDDRKKIVQRPDAAINYQFLDRRDDGTNPVRKRI